MLLVSRIVAVYPQMKSESERIAHLPTESDPTAPICGYRAEWSQENDDWIERWRGRLCKMCLAEQKTELSDEQQPEPWYTADLPVI